MRKHQGIDLHLLELIRACCINFLGIHKWCSNLGVWLIYSPQIIYLPPTPCNVTHAFFYPPSLWISSFMRDPCYKWMEGLPLFESIKKRERHESTLSWPFFSNLETIAQTTNYVWSFFCVCVIQIDNKTSFSTSTKRKNWNICCQKDSR